MTMTNGAEQMETTLRTMGSSSSLSPRYLYADERDQDLLLKGGRAAIVQHDIYRPPEIHEVFEVREFTISHPYFDDSGEMGPAIRAMVTVFLQLKRHRHWHAFSAFPSDQQFFTVEQDGRVIFDSRSDVPWPPDRQFKNG